MCASVLKKKSVINLLHSSHLDKLQKKLEGYKFPVYTTEFCPRNKTEWEKRAPLFNCTSDESYACLPNEDITDLLEFCYPLQVISIQGGKVIKNLYTQHVWCFYFVIFTCMCVTYSLSICQIGNRNLSPYSSPLMIGYILVFPFL